MQIAKRALPFLILLLAAPVLAATGRWSPLGPDGGTVTALAVDPVDSRIVYATTQKGEGVFKSRDGGQTWSPSGAGLPKIPGNNVFCLAIDPRRPTILYLGTLNFGIYKSTDGGASWSPSQRGLSANLLGVIALAIDPRAPDTVFAGTGVGVFKTTDGGAHWKLKNGGLPNAPQVSDLEIDPKRTAVIYAAVGTSGVYKSANGGETWRPINHGLPARQGVDTLAIDPRRSATVYASTYAGLFKSTNGGASWFPSNTGLPKSFVSTLVIDPRNSRTLFAGTFFGTGAFRSDDGGASWSPINAGLSNLVIWALAITPQGTVYAATEGDSKPGGVFQSADGRTWRRTVRGLSTLEITALAAESAGPGAPPILWAGTPSLGVFRSSNGGGVWRRVPIAGVSGPVNAIVVDPASAGTAWVLAYERDGFGGLTIRDRRRGADLVPPRHPRGRGRPVLLAGARSAQRHPLARRLRPRAQHRRRPHLDRPGRDLARGLPRGPGLRPVLSPGPLCRGLPATPFPLRALRGATVQEHRRRRLVDADRRRAGGFFRGPRGPGEPGPIAGGLRRVFRCPVPQRGRGRSLGPRG